MNSVRIAKIAQVMQSVRLLRALVDHHVLAGAEHRSVLNRELATVIDIGANRGQFALAVRRWAPAARVISFEPLSEPASVFRKLFSGDSQVTLHEAAIGAKTKPQVMHISKQNDSSSLLPLTSVQTTMYPGTQEVATTEVLVGPLDDFVCAGEIKQPAMLKLDVQGYEYEALKGCALLLPHFQWVYCECSFIEFYAGQKLAPDVIEFLAKRGFVLSDICNPSYCDSGHCVQADFLFSWSLTGS